MALRVNTFLSETNFTEYYKKGITLKSCVLKHWLKRKRLKQSFVAAQLGMDKRKFKRKLYKRCRFNKAEIKELVRLLGVRAAISVIWFPSLQEKRRIQKYVWEGKMNCKYNPCIAHCLETSMEKKARRIAEQEKEYGANWEQSEEFENLIFDSDELPSHRFMRRRNG